MEAFPSSLHSRLARAPLLHPVLVRTNPLLVQNPSVPLAAPLGLHLVRRDSRLYCCRSWRLPLSLRRMPGFPLARASRTEAELPGSVDGRIVVSSAVTVVLAVLNRVLYKLALVPMKQYPFFLAQLTTFGYVAVYFSILYIRYSAGIVTKDMLALPKSRFVAIGLLEALGVALGMSAAAMLPGPAIPILSQSFLVWQLLLSILILGKKYSFNQVFGCLLVTIGVILAVASGANEGQLLSGVEFQWPALMVASSAFQAAASIIKEFVFRDGARRLQGNPVDIFVVNSFGSGFQALFVFLLLPFLSNLRGIPFSELPGYLKSGAACFLNIGGNMTAFNLSPTEFPTEGWI